MALSYFKYVTAQFCESYPPTTGSILFCLGMHLSLQHCPSCYNHSNQRERNHSHCTLVPVINESRPRAVLLEELTFLQPRLCYQSKSGNISCVVVQDSSHSHRLSEEVSFFCISMHIIRSRGVNLLALLSKICSTDVCTCKQGKLVCHDDVKKLRKREVSFVPPSSSSSDGGEGEMSEEDDRILSTNRYGVNLSL